MYFVCFFLKKDLPFVNFLYRLKHPSENHKILTGHKDKKQSSITSFFGRLGESKFYAVGTCKYLGT